MTENQQYAGFWIRVCAALIDSIAVFIAVILPLSWLFGMDYMDGVPTSRGLLPSMIQFVLPIVITVWFWKKYLGTPGKMILKLRVVDAKTGLTLSTPQAIGRYLGYYVSILPFMLGIIWVGIDKKKQGFHDKLAGTVVVRDLR